MPLVDTHCHIHSADFPLPLSEVEERAAAADVTLFICVGTDAADSEQAVRFVQDRENHWASIGIHPHEAKDGEPALQRLASLLAGDTPRVLSSGPPQLSDKFAESRALPRRSPPAAAELEEALVSEEFKVAKPRVAPKEGTPPPAAKRGRWEVALGDEARGAAARKIVAIGECGLDYFYGHSPKEDQEKALRFQIELALSHNLPLIFHVRDAFDDFWPIFDSYQGIRGVVHSFTDNRDNLKKLLDRGLYVGINGITTFTKNEWQLENAKAVPGDRLLLETDAPFLTPVPLRGRVNEPANVRLVAEFLANLRNESLETLITQTTRNSLQLFSIQNT